MDATLGLIIGICISVVGSAAANLGQNLQKKAQTSNPDRAYTSLPTWWFGLILVAIGGVTDIVSLNFAPATVVTPVGASTLVFNFFFAWLFFNEVSRWIDLMGTALIISGAVVVSLCYSVFGSPPVFTADVERILQLCERHQMTLYWTIVGIEFLFLFWIMSLCEYLLHEHQEESRQYKRWARLHPVSYPAMAGLFSAHTVLICKAILAVSTSSVSENQWWNDSPLMVVPYIGVVLLIVCVVGQLHFLTKGLAYFDSLFVIPVFQCFHIASSVLGGGFYYGEMDGFDTTQWIVFLASIMLIVVGVLLLATRKMDKVHSEILPAEKQQIQLDSAETKNRSFNDTTVILDASNQDHRSVHLPNDAPNSQQVEMPRTLHSRSLSVKRLRHTLLRRSMNRNSLLAAVMLGVMCGALFSVWYLVTRDPSGIYSRYRGAFRVLMALCVLISVLVGGMMFIKKSIKQTMVKAVESHPFDQSSKVTTSHTSTTAVSLTIQPSQNQGQASRSSTLGQTYDEAEAEADGAEYPYRIEFVEKLHLPKPKPNDSTQV